MTDTKQNILLQIDIDATALNQKLQQTLNQVKQFTDSLSGLKTKLKEAFQTGSNADITNLSEQINKTEVSISALTGKAGSYQKQMEGINTGNATAKDSFGQLSAAAAVTGGQLTAAISEPLKGISDLIEATRTLQGGFGNIQGEPAGTSENSTINIGSNSSENSLAGNPSPENNSKTLTDSEALNKQLDTVTQTHEQARQAMHQQTNKANSQSDEQYYHDASALFGAVSDAFTEAKNEELNAAGTNAEKKKEVEKKYALIELAITSAKIIANTAQAVQKTNAEVGWPAAIPLDAILVATGAVEEGVAIAQYNKVASMAKGGIIGGKPHSHGGTKFFGSDGSMFEAERGELIAVVNKNSTSMLNHLSFLNKMGGGVDFFPQQQRQGGFFADGGLVARNVSAPVEEQAAGERFAGAIANAIQNAPVPVVRVRDIVYATNDRIVRVDDKVNI